MASAFSLPKGKKAKSGSGDYQALLKKNMARYKDRDEAVRKTNIATGHGNSTAQKFMHEGAARPKAASGGAGKSVDRRKTSSTKRKGNFSLPKEAPVPTPRSAGSPDLAVSPPHERDTMMGAPTNTPPVTAFSPDLAVSPPHPADPMAAGAPHGMGMSGLGYTPPGFPSDLAVSPQHPADPMALSAPQFGSLEFTGRPPVAGSGGPVGAGNPLVGAQPGPNTLVGSGGASGAGNPLIDPSWIKRLLGLGA